MKHVKKIILFILLVIPGISFSAEENFVKGFTDSIGEVQEEFSELSKGESAEAKIIDEAIKEIDEATEFVKAVEKRTGLKIGCLEEIALNYNWIKKEDLQNRISDLKGDYYNYLKEI